MTKYHVSPRTGKAAVCKADKRACRYGAPNYGAAYHAQEELNQRILNEQFERVHTAASAGVKGVTYPTPLQEPVKLFKEAPVPDGVDYETTTSQAGGYYSDEDDSDSEHFWDDHAYIDDIDFKSVDIAQVLAETFKVKTEQVPANIIAEAKALDYDKPASWELYAVSDYYADAVQCDYPAGFKEFAEKHFYSQANAEDRTGVLNRVRSYGVTTDGLLPVDAVKKYLSVDGKPLKAVQGKTKVQKKGAVKLDQVHVANNQNFPAPSVPQGNSMVAGFIVKNRTTGYTLVGDATKFNQLRENGRQSGMFFLLT